MSYISNKISNLFKQLLPNGRAFYVPFDGWMEKLNTALGGDGTNKMGTYERAYNDAVSVLDSILPDNDNFTDGTADPLNNDCNDWERRLGLIQYGITSASTPTRLQRMAAIAVKMAYPGSDRPRQSAGYLQDQLQAAGFNVFVYENIFMPGGVTKTPAQILSSTYPSAIHGFTQHGQVQHGQLPLKRVTKIANYIEESKDALFVIGSNYRSTFFIAGAAIDTFADVSIYRKAEFRQMILRLKPAHMCGFMFVNYI